MFCGSFLFFFHLDTSFSTEGEKIAWKKMYSPGQCLNLGKFTLFKMFNVVMSTLTDSLRVARGHNPL